MIQQIIINNNTELIKFGVYPINIDINNPPYKTFGLKNDSNILCAICSIWIDNIPNYQNRKLAALGNFYAINEDFGAKILEIIKSYLKQIKKDFIIGPMNCNTWNDYRFMTWQDKNFERFPLEPWNTNLYPEIFKNFGFKTIGKYFSSVLNIIDQEESLTKMDFLLNKSLEKSGNKILSLGDTITKFDVDYVTSEIIKITNSAYKDSFLYVPINNLNSLLSNKIKLYDNNISCIALDSNDQILGYLLSILDSKERCILKTTGILGFDNSISLSLFSYPLRFFNKIYNNPNIIVSTMHEKAMSYKLCDEIFKTKIIREYQIYGIEI